jgi:hypothetical protein
LKKPLEDSVVTAENDLKLLQKFWSGFSGTEAVLGTPVGVSIASSSGDL